MEQHLLHLRDQQHRKMTRLSVNINKIATLRNARGGNLPDVEKAAVDIQGFGAEGITVHPRPDERHIRYADVRLLRQTVATHLTLQMAPSEEMVAFAVELAHAFGTTDAWQAVRDWFRRCFKYDDKQALTLERLSAFPDPVTCWRRSRGFGQDAASMAAGMFRAVGIPTRLCIGHADGSLHAWAESVIDGGIRRFDPRGTPVQIYHRERWF